MSKLPAEMPQEDVETKSLLTLILEKITELWVNIQSGFTNLTNHINAKTIQINSDLGKPLNVQATEHYESLINNIDFLYQKSLNTGNSLSMVYTHDEGRILNYPTNLIMINSSCEIVSLNLQVAGSNQTKMFKMVIDDDLYYLYATSEMVYVISNHVGHSGSPGATILETLYYKGSFVGYPIEGSSRPIALNKNASTNLATNGSNVRTVYTIGTIKAYQKFSLDLFEIPPNSGGVYVSWAVLARL